MLKFCVLVFLISFVEILQIFPAIASSEILFLKTKQLGFVKKTLAKSLTGLTDFPDKRATTKIKYLLTICQILRKSPKKRRENSRNSRKLT